VVVAVVLHTTVLTEGVLTNEEPREEELLCLALTERYIWLHVAALVALLYFIVDTSDVRLALQEMAQGSILADAGLPHCHHHRYHS
jgi:hypothetical protein